jgi:hypothetical protein
MHKSGKITAIAMKLRNIGTSLCNLNQLCPYPEIEENKIARRRMKKTLMLVKCRYVSLNGWTVMKRMASKVKVIAIPGKTIAFPKKV